jgi:hypothetical protein
VEAAEDMVSLADYAWTYSDLGWALLPLDGKNPKGHGWQRTLPLDPDDAADIWSRRGSNNMGIVLGHSGVIDYEMDGGTLEEYLSLVGGKIPETLAYRTGSGKLHILFRDPGGLTRRTRGGFELRAGPHQSVLPPSIHPETGKPYEWINGPADYPLLDPPQALLEYFAETPGQPAETHWREALKGKLGEGEGRYQSLLSYLGRAVNEYDSPEDLVAAAIAYCSVAHDPPYPDEVIEGHALDIWHKWREEPVVEAEGYEALNIVTADKIKMRSVEFLWKPYLQRSAFHLLVGRKGAGKGSILAWIAAQVTVGAAWGDPRPVLWIATEDSFEIDVKPRFVVQGGEERMLLCVQQSVRLPQDLGAIESVCREWGVGLVVVDPIVGTIGAASTNDEGAVVAAIGGLNQLADTLDLSVIGVRHLGKDSDRDVLDRVLGSAAWVNTPRAVLGVAQDEDTKVVTLEVLAGNRVRSRDSFDFDLNEDVAPGVDEPVSKVDPKGSFNSSVNDIIGKKRVRKAPQVKEWVLELMEEGTPLTKEGLAMECMQRFGVGMSTLHAVCTELKEEGRLKYLPPANGPDGKILPGTKWYFTKT